MDFSSQVSTTQEHYFVPLHIIQYIGDDSMNDNKMNEQLLQILGGLDKEKLEKVTNMVKNMSSDELAGLAKMIGINNKNNG